MNSCLLALLVASMAALEASAATENVVNPSMAEQHEFVVTWNCVNTGGSVVGNVATNSWDPNRAAQVCNSGLGLCYGRCFARNREAMLMERAADVAWNCVYNGNVVGSVSTPYLTRAQAIRKCDLSYSACFGQCTVE